MSGKGNTHLPANLSFRRLSSCWSGSLRSVFFFDFILGVGLVLNTIFVDAVFSIACLETVAPPQVPPMARKQAGAKDKEAEEAKAGGARKQTPPKAEEAAEEEEEKPARALGSAIFLAVVFGQLSIVM